MQLNAELQDRLQELESRHKKAVREIEVRLASARAARRMLACEAVGCPPSRLWDALQERTERGVRDSDQKCKLTVEELKARHDQELQVSQFVPALTEQARDSACCRLQLTLNTVRQGIKNLEDRWVGVGPRPFTHLSHYVTCVPRVSSLDAEKKVRVKVEADKLRNKALADGLKHTAE